LDDRERPPRTAMLIVRYCG